MSRQKQNPVVNRTELKVLIVRFYGNQKLFCNHYRINYSTFRSYMKGVETMPQLNERIIRIMRGHGIDPFQDDNYLAKTVQLPAAKEAV